MTAEQEILSAYGENPNAIYSINEIARRIGKAYPNVHKTVRTLVDKGILKRHEVGRSHLCSVNLDDNRAVLLLALNHTSKYESLTEDIKQQVAKLKARPHDIILYHETRDELIIVNQEPATDSITPQQLHRRLLEDETLYSHHTLIAGYENFYSLITTPEITRRYHPLL